MYDLIIIAPVLIKHKIAETAMIMATAPIVSTPSTPPRIIGVVSSV
jgi:hypothetical protein